MLCERRAVHHYPGKMGWGGPQTDGQSLQASHEFDPASLKARMQGIINAHAGLNCPEQIHLPHLYSSYAGLQIIELQQQLRGVYTQTLSSESGIKQPELKYSPEVRVIQVRIAIYQPATSNEAGATQTAGAMSVSSNNEANAINGGGIRQEPGLSYRDYLSVDLGAEVSWCDVFDTLRSRVKEGFINAAMAVTLPGKGLGEAMTALSRKIGSLPKPLKLAVRAAEVVIAAEILSDFSQPPQPASAAPLGKTEVVTGRGEQQTQFTWGQPEPALQQPGKCGTVIAPDQVPDFVISRMDGKPLRGLFLYLKHDGQLLTSSDVSLANEADVIRFNSWLGTVELYGNKPSLPEAVIVVGHDDGSGLGFEDRILNLLNQARETKLIDDRSTLLDIKDAFTLMGIPESDLAAVDFDSSSCPEPGFLMDELEVNGKTFLNKRIMNTTVMIDGKEYDGKAGLIAGKPVLNVNYNDQTWNIFLTTDKDDNLMWDVENRTLSPQLASVNVAISVTLSTDPIATNLRRLMSMSDGVGDNKQMAALIDEVVRSCTSRTVWVYRQVGESGPEKIRACSVIAIPIGGKVAGLGYTLAVISDSESQVLPDGTLKSVATWKPVDQMDPREIDGAVDCAGGSAGYLPHIKGEPTEKVCMEGTMSTLVTLDDVEKLSWLLQCALPFTKADPVQAMACDVNKVLNPVTPFTDQEKLVLGNLQIGKILVPGLIGVITGLGGRLFVRRNPGIAAVIEMVGLGIGGSVSFLFGFPAGAFATVVGMVVALAKPQK